MTNEGLIIDCELAGMRSKDLQITLEANGFRISGTRERRVSADDSTPLFNEINDGAFETVVVVPSGYNLSEAKANYVNGFLRIHVPMIRRFISG